MDGIENEVMKDRQRKRRVGLKCGENEWVRVERVEGREGWG